MVPNPKTPGSLKIPEGATQTGGRGTRRRPGRGRRPGSGGTAPSPGGPACTPAAR